MSVNEDNKPEYKLNLGQFQRPDTFANSLKHVNKIYNQVFGHLKRKERVFIDVMDSFSLKYALKLGAKQTPPKGYCPYASFYK